MARAMLLFERQADASWLPTAVILATPKRLQGKALPGNPDRDARMSRILSDALPPRINDNTDERGSFEDWIDWGVWNLDNGHTTWASEVKPTLTVDELYQREVLDGIPADAPVDAPETDAVGQATEEPSSTEYRVEASERDDDLLRQYLPSERPPGFDALPADERAWRGRYVLMTWAFTGNLTFAWAAASVRDPIEVEEMKKVVADVPDSRIEEELVRTAAERGDGNVIFASLGEPPSSPAPTVASYNERRHRYEEMQRLRQEGRTLEQIAEVFGLTRERVRQVLVREPRRSGRPPKNRTPERERSPSSPDTTCPRESPPRATKGARRRIRPRRRSRSKPWSSGRERRAHRAIAG